MILDNFATTQEGAQKDVEDGLVLQAQWAVIYKPCRFGKGQFHCNMMITCIIMHNMIIEDKKKCDQLTLKNWGCSSGGMHQGFTYADLQCGTNKIDNKSPQFLCVPNIANKGNNYYG